MKKNLFILALFLVIVGCDQTKNNWIKAKQSNSIAEVMKFLKENPKSEFDLEARNFLDSLNWEIVKKSNSVDTIQMFIESKPNLIYIEKAKAAVDTLKKSIVIPFKLDYKYIIGSFRAVSKMVDGPLDPYLCIYDPPIYAPGSFEYIKYKDKTIELIDNNISNGIIKTKKFGNFIVFLHGYRLDDGRSVISFLSTNENLIKLKEFLQIK
jgi:hypothetical protein